MQSNDKRLCVNQKGKGGSYLTSSNAGAAQPDVVQLIRVGTANYVLQEYHLTYLRLLKLYVRID